MTDDVATARRILFRAFSRFAGNVDSDGTIGTGSYQATYAGLYLSLDVKGDGAALLSIHGFHDKAPSPTTLLSLFKAKWRPGDQCEVLAWLAGPWEQAFVGYDA